jgi:hypothetical protein
VKKKTDKHPMADKANPKKKAGKTESGALSDEALEQVSGGGGLTVQPVGTQSALQQAMANIRNKIYA